MMTKSIESLKVRQRVISHGSLSCLLPSALKNGFDKSQDIVEISGVGLWKPDSKLVDGLFVPPKIPRKLNKLLRKQVKGTTRTKWYVHYDGSFFFFFVPFPFLS